MNLNKEAEEYKNTHGFSSKSNTTTSWNERGNTKSDIPLNEAKEGLKRGFIAGTNSNYVKIEKIQFAIQQFKNLTEKQGGYSFKDVTSSLKQLEEQLKQLEQ